MSDNVARITRMIVQLLGERDAASSICPSEVARALAADEAAWRALMPQIRQVAADMQDAGTLRITRGDVVVEREDMAHGPIRLRKA